jgi:AcrR family transcriptional regulator
MATADPPLPGVRETLLVAARAELAERGHAAISLRAVARRAGVSHAAPKYHFRDRAGLLTAIAVEGFAALAEALRRVGEPDAEQHLAALGRAYVDFGLTKPALFDLMFRPTELHPDDPVLHQARRDAIDPLRAAVARLGTCDDASPESSPLTLISWAFVHGLVVLTRDNALQTGAEPAGLAAAGLAHELTDLFSAYVGRGQGTLPRRPGRGP